MTSLLGGKWGITAKGRASLTELLLRLPDHGIGARVTRRRWLKYPGTHFRITGVQPAPRAANAASVEGNFTFLRRTPEATNRSVRGASKREWILLSRQSSQGEVFLQPDMLPEEHREEWSSAMAEWQQDR